MSATVQLGGAASGALGAEQLSDGPLRIGWTPSASCSLHCDEQLICLVDGPQYAPAGGAAAVAGAYRQRGEACLHELRGDLWVLLWDRRARRGLIATDQIGGNCPYFTERSGALLVASELRDLIAALPGRPPPDPLSVAHWLLSTPSPDGATLFAGVRRLEAGHRLALGPGSAAAPARWWSLRYRRPAPVGAEQATAQVRERLVEAVRRRLVPGEGNGVLLSGGLDSSSVAALATVAGARPHAYSATFPEHPTVDEAALIDAIVERLELPATRLEVRGGSVLAGAIEYMRAWEVPPQSPNLFFWMPLLRRAGAEGTRVLLDGEGGDELFGLSPYLIADHLRHGRIRAAFASAQGWPPPYGNPTRQMVRARVRLYGVKAAVPAWVHPLARRLRRGTGHSYAPGWLEPRLAQQWLDSESEPYSWKRLDGPRWWSALAAILTRGPGPALVFEQTRRRAAMGGLEARHPLLDVDVLELVLGLPPELAFDERFSRPLLRGAVAGLLPEEVRTRTGKSNFDALFHASLAGRELPLARELLGAPDAELRAFTDLDLLRAQLIDRGAPEGAYDRQQWAILVWRILTAECWLRAQAGRPLPGALAGDPPGELLAFA